MSATDTLTAREMQYVALRAAARAAFDAVRHLSFRDPARIAAREAVQTLREAAADIADFPQLREGLQLGRSQNVASRLYSQGVYYSHGHVPAGHDGYIGHFTPRELDYAEGDDLGFLRHMDALYAALRERGMLAD